MTDRETNIRSVLFLVIGILLLLSLVICIYIVSGEKDLVQIDSTVIDVKKDADGTGKNEVTVIYEVDGTSYEYNFYHKEDVNVDDKIPIFYHSENATSVTTYKVPKIIFICPVIGLILCILGLYELFKKNSNNDGEEEFKTSVIGVVGNTQQLKIVADDTEAQKYEKTTEEKVEPVVKTIKKVVTVQTKPAETESTTAAAAVVVPPVPEKKVSSSPIIIEKKVEEKEPEKEQPVEPPVEKTVEPEIPAKEDLPVEVPKPAEKKVSTMVEADPSVNTQPVVSKTPEVKPEEKTTEEKVADKAPDMTDAIVKKVQNTMASADSKKVTIDEDDIKQAIKDVLKEVIAEVKEEKTPPKKVEQRRVLPNYYYISGTSLIYEEAGKEAKEISLKTVKNVVRTVNSEGNVVKLIVSNEEIKCILTNMKNIDLEQVASLLNNKMRTIDESFKEEVEYKEY